MDCVILCGGKSSRMQTNKALLPFGAYKIITYQYLKLSKIFENVFISCKTHHKESLLNAIYSDFLNNNIDLEIPDSRLLLEESEIFSPLVGILHSLQMTNAKKLFFLSCDCPLVKPKTIQILINNSLDYDVLYAKDSLKSHPLVAVWSDSTISLLQNAIEMEDFRIMDLVERVSNKSIFFDKLEFVNVNTKSDYKRALQLLEL